MNSISQLPNPTPLEESDGRHRAQVVSAQFSIQRWRSVMTTKKIIALTTAAISVCAIAVMAAIILQTFANAQTADSHYTAQYTASGEMILPPDNIWRQWVYVGSPLTPNALNNGNANFPEYHNVYIQPWAYEQYVKTGKFPEDTIMFKELQLTLPPAKFSDGSRIQPSGRGYFPGPYNGADVTVKDTKRYADTGGWGYFDFNHFEPKAKMTTVQPKDKCAFCHIGSAKKDEVWTQFYRMLDQ